MSAEASAAGIPYPPPPSYRFRVDGKRTLITGASNGIGREAAIAFARRGARVAVSGRSADKLEELAEDIRGEGGTAVVVPADLSDKGQADDLAGRAAEALGGLDVLINNAGGAGAYIEGGSSGLFGTPPGTVDELFQLNVLSAYALARSAAFIMRDAGRGGCIINNSSIQAIYPTWNLGPYAAMKAALETFTRVWAQELGPWQIRVNGLAPGGVISGNLQRLIDDPNDRAAREATIPMGWLAVPEDAAAALVFLASDDARWVSGTTIVLSGGRTGVPNYIRPEEAPRP